jgi:ABC-type transport system involved in multi-copper enzyme maturation permease subunit
MTAKRILKEARPLMWPWCAVTVVSVLTLVLDQSHFSLHGIPHSIAEAIYALGFLAGISLLATLSLGNEFQHRTLSLLLTQPADRMEIWSEKFTVTLMAVLSAALILFFVTRVTTIQLDPVDTAFAGAWIIAITASATFWTLVARSTLGGIALNVGVHFFIVTLPWLKVADRIRGAGYLTPENSTVLAVTFLFLCYAGGMLWLGRRALAEFQVTGGMAGDDLLMAGPDVMPEALAGRFRCRPTGPVLNLIRKELRLLRPLWLFTPLAGIWLTLSRLVPETRALQAEVFAGGVINVWFIAILAGSLSLGEERTSGTHSWQMTLPVSARRQWLTKLLMALSAGFVCAVLLPALVVIAGGFLFGLPFRFVDAQTGMVWLLGVFVVTFASFWCACAVNGTVRAVLWLFPVMGALLLVLDFGGRVARELMDLVLLRIDPFADFKFTNAVSNINFFTINATPMLRSALLLVPTLLFAVIQSYRMFRAQLQDRTLSVMRSLIPLAIVAFLCSFSFMALFAFVHRAKLQMWAMFRETHEAIVKIQPSTTNLDATHPLQLTAEDLAKAFPLSERTRRWLRDSRITVSPEKPFPGRAGQYCCGGNSRGVTFSRDKDYSWYLATIHLPSGSHCTLAFEGGQGWGILGGVCE